MASGAQRRRQDPQRERKLTWGELKRRLEAAGVRDEDEIDRIDISWGNPEAIECVHDEDFGWRIIL